MTRTRQILALLALVVALGQPACAVHADGEAAYLVHSGPGVAVASAHEGPDCDAQPVLTPASRQLPDVAIVAGVTLRASLRIYQDDERDRSSRSGTRTPGLSSPLRL